MRVQSPVTLPRALQQLADRGRGLTPSPAPWSHLARYLHDSSSLLTYVAAASQMWGAAAAFREQVLGTCRPAPRSQLYACQRRDVWTSRQARYLRTLNDIALARSLAVTRGSFLASAHRELSLAVVKSQGEMYRSCALLLEKAAGRKVLPGADTPFLH
jgi:hypothetical protein